MRFKFFLGNVIIPSASVPDSNNDQQGGATGDLLAHAPPLLAKVKFLIRPHSMRKCKGWGEGP